VGTSGIATTFRQKSGKRFRSASTGISLLNYNGGDTKGGENVCGKGEEVRRFEKGKIMNSPQKEILLTDLEKKGDTKGFGKRGNVLQRGGENREGSGY